MRPVRGRIRARAPHAGPPCPADATPPVGFQKSAIGADLGFFRGPLVLVDQATEDWPTLDPLLGKVDDRVVGPGRAELAAAMGTPTVVLALVPGQDSPQVPLAEKEHPVGDLCPDGSTNLSA
jgi:hypothetical protein